MFKRFLQKLFDIHPDSMDFRSGLNLTGLPIISLEQGDKVFNFILDTGSSVNVIDSNILDQIEHRMIDNKDASLYGMEGNRLPVGVCNITLGYKDKTYPYDYLIRDMSKAFSNLKKDHGATVHGLLGSSFFNKYRYILDFNELIAYSKA